MLRGIIICPDADVTHRLESALADLGLVSITRVLDHYPNTLELMRFVRAHAPHVIFLSTESMTRATELLREMDQRLPGIQTVAISRVCDPQLLLECMKLGIREFCSLPIDVRSLGEALNRIHGVVESKPPAIETTEQVFAFLPSKAGVGTSTIALNTAMCLSAMPDTNALLSDFDMNSGMVRFMLKLDNTFCVTDACERALNMDENLWPQLVTKVDKLDVLHAGKLNPDLRIEAPQIRHLIEFMRRNYRVLCFDLSGNLERYSLEIMHESKRIMLVCTPEIPSLHLAREKYMYLKRLDLGDRVCVLVNRCQKRPMITPQQIEQLLGLPVHMTLPNDYHGVQRALTLGKPVDATTDLGKQFRVLAQSMVESPRPQSLPDQKKRFIEYFSLIPGRGGALATKTAS